LEMANGIEPDHAGRLQAGIINTQFTAAGGNGPEYAAAVKAAVDRGYMTLSVRRLYGLHPGGRRPFRIRTQDGIPGPTIQRCPGPPRLMEMVRPV
jgi:hypothetical protein